MDDNQYPAFCVQFVFVFITSCGTGKIRRFLSVFPEKRYLNPQGSSNLPKRIRSLRRHDSLANSRARSSRSSSNVGVPVTDGALTYARIWFISEAGVSPLVAVAPRRMASAFI